MGTFLPWWEKWPAWRRPRLALHGPTSPNRPVRFGCWASSSGAHLAALVALSNHPLPQTCPHDPGEIAGMIGLAGPYDLNVLWNEGILDQLWQPELIVEHLPQTAAWLGQGGQTAMRVFLRLLTGSTPQDPDSWNALNPIQLVENHPQRRFLLLTGGEDELVFPSQSERFAQALVEAEHDVSLEIIPHQDHAAMLDPLLVGAAILAFLGTTY